MDIHLCFLDRCNKRVWLLPKSIWFIHGASVVFYWNWLWCFVSCCCGLSCAKLYVLIVLFEFHLHLKVRIVAFFERYYCFLCAKTFSLTVFLHGTQLFLLCFAQVFGLDNKYSVCFQLCGIFALWCFGRSMLTILL